MTRTPINRLARAQAFAVIAWLAAASTAVAAPPGYTQIWNDEFDGTTLDQSKWTPETVQNPHNNERQAYLPEMITVANGDMVITSTNQPSGNKQYRSGRVHSDWTHQYGRWEIRADLPTSKGMWPAIWLLPDTTQYTWPNQGEIDIMENRGSQPQLTSSAYHYGTFSPYNHQYKYSEQTAARFGQPVNFHQGYHTFAVDWDETKLRFYVDDVHYYTLYNSDVGGFIGNQTAPMQTILNTAVGGDFLGDQQPDASTVWPQKFLIDYVRVFERNDDPLRLQNGRFEANDGSLAGWTVFGNRLNTNNVSVHNEAVADGIASLKLFGQSAGGTNYSGVSQGISVSGGDQVTAAVESFIRSQDSISGTNNSVQLKIEFYNDFGGKYGTPAMLGEFVETIVNGSTANNVWQPHDLTATAPAGAVEARVALVFTQTGNAAGAVHFDNLSFKNLSLPDYADADGNGTIDGADFLIWQRNMGKESPVGPAEGDFNFDGVVDAADLEIWKSQDGTTVPPDNHGASLQIPEPSSAMLTITTLVGLMHWRSGRLPAVAAEASPV
ncbi:family 16 glycosylhydrolase [Lacipirellula parvula]|nr:family 16 glycosylhydrolase [Lacipirellula parvula]